MRAFRTSIAARALILALVATAPRAADDPERTARVFELWLDRFNVPAGVLVLHHQGKPVVSFSKGWDLAQSVDLASLSKAITALCVAELVSEGRLAWSDTVRARLGKGPDVTLAALVTHSGGIWPDSTQGLWGLAGLLGGSTADSTARAAFSRDLDPGAVSAFRYNNENYALLELIIEQASGRDYETTCGEQVLDDAGVTEAGRSSWGANAMGWGGWAMPVAQYARFHTYMFGANGTYVFAEEEPSVAIPGQIYYGLGSFWRDDLDGRHFWHFGTSCLLRPDNSGAFAITYGGEWTLVAAYQACLVNEAPRALYDGLVAVLRGL